MKKSLKKLLLFSFVLLLSFTFYNVKAHAATGQYRGLYMYKEPGFSSAQDQVNQLNSRGIYARVYTTIYSESDPYTAYSVVTGTFNSELEASIACGRYYDIINADDMGYRIITGYFNTSESAQNIVNYLSSKGLYSRVVKGVIGTTVLPPSYDPTPVYRVITGFFSDQSVATNTSNDINSKFGIYSKVYEDRK